MVNRNDQCKLTLLRNDLHKQANGGLKNDNINNLMLTNHFILQLKPLFMGIWGGGFAKQSQEYSVYVAKVSVSQGKNASKRKQGSG